VARFAVETRVARLAVEIRLAKLAVEIWFTKLAVETRLAKLAVETKLNPPNPVEIYPTVPNPITVLVRLAVVKAPMIFVA
jgi:hypothetical protein